MKRYAIYYAPPPGGFAQAGAAWLGWDAASGQPVAQPDPALGLNLVLEAGTAAPTLEAAISSSFAFGGTNAALLFTRG